MPHKIPIGAALLCGPIFPAGFPAVTSQTPAQPGKPDPHKAFPGEVGRKPIIRVVHPGDPAIVTVLIRYRTGSP